MKKISILLIVVFCLFSASTQAQQIHQLTQYMVNDFAFNPAVAGSQDKFISKFGFRKQWAGIEGAPTTGLLSIHGNLSEKRSVGLGLLLYGDATGPTRRNGLQLAYAYQLPLNLEFENETFLGFGIAGALTQYSLRFDELILHDAGDPQIGTGNQSKLGGDAHLGIYLSNPKYWVGLSLNQLFASKFTFEGAVENIKNARHFYVTGGYNFAVSEKFGLSPGAILKMVKGTRPQAELNLRAIYDKQYWLGLAYRTEDAVSVLLGIDLKQGFNFTYAYDITTSNLNQVSNGSHEITIGYNFNVPKVIK
ncbi:MAG: type IX secretion system membrane protein PorP/SprF [Sphingobacteriales bacterium]|nr:MAG: type IX secretion system membrane protein PorP/SprF [Sphingobacteriales bacterium]